MPLRQAFLLGAGLGTRLRPLTEDCPKPMVPIFHRPLIEYAIDHVAALGVRRVMINTHHAPHCYTRHFSSGSHRGVAVDFRHEPTLLDTAGGLRNIRDWLLPETLLLYNGDILTDLPLEEALQQHRESGYEVTLLLRDSGGPLQISLPANATAITDIRGTLGDSHSPRRLYTGIAFIEPAFLDRIPSDTILSLVDPWLAMLQSGAGVGGFVENRGVWFDIGTPERYRAVHQVLLTSPLQLPEQPPIVAIHPDATIAPSARLASDVIIGPGASVGAHARLASTILWPDAHAAPHCDLREVIVRTQQTAGGNLVDAIL